MAVTDIGPKPTVFDIEEETTANQDFRRVAWSGKYLQVTLMTIPVGEEIGLELHADTDQFLRVEAGQGRVEMGVAEDRLDFVREVGDDFVILVPAGKWHNVTNTGTEPLQLYSIYAPAHHKPGKVHRTREIAELDEDDAPADWSIQPPWSEDAH